MHATPFTQFTLETAGLILFRTWNLALGVAINLKYVLITWELDQVVLTAYFLPWNDFFLFTVNYYKSLKIYIAPLFCKQQFKSIAFRHNSNRA